MRSHGAPRFVPPVLIAVCMLLIQAGLAVSPARAQEQEGCVEWDDVTLSAGQELDCNLFVLRGSLYLEPGATVDGSVNVPLGSARIDGLVTGDIWVGRDLEVSGEIEGDAAAMGGYVEVEGRIRGDLANLAGDITIAESGSVGGDLSAAGDVTIEGEVGGDLSAGGDLAMPGRAAVGGDVTVTGRMDRSDAATIGGQSAASRAEPSSLVPIGWALLMVLFTAIFGALVVNIMPGAIANVRDAAGGSKLLTVFLGLLSLLLFPFLSLLILPLAIYLAALMIGVVGAGEHLGSRLASGSSRSLRAALGSGVLALLAAGVLVLATKADEIPLAAFCGSMVLLGLIFVWPLGAGFVTLLGRRPWPRPLADIGAPEPGPLAPGAERAVVPSPEPLRESPDLSPSPEAGALPEQTPWDASHDAAPAEPQAPDPIEVLRQVPGITPVYAGLLAEAGIEDVASIAAADPAALVELASMPGVMPVDLETAEAWVRAARELLDRD